MEEAERSRCGGGCGGGCDGGAYQRWNNGGEWERRSGGGLGINRTPFLRTKVKQNVNLIFTVMGGEIMLELVEVLVEGGCRAVGVITA